MQNQGKANKNNLLMTSNSCTSDNRTEITEQNSDFKLDKNKLIRDKIRIFIFPEKSRIRSVVIS